jgi:hypothetical protein
MARKDDGLSTGAKIGIGVGIAAGIAAIGAGIAAAVGGGGKGGAKPVLRGEGGRTVNLSKVRGKFTGGCGCGR